MAWNTPLTFMAGAKHTAAVLNAGIRDCLRALGDPWTAYDPAWSGTIGNGTIAGRYRQVGKTIDFSIEIVGGSATVWPTGPTLTLPFTRLSNVREAFLGTARIGTSSYPLYFEAATATTTLGIRADPTTAGAALRTLSATVPAAWGAGDTLTVRGTYEAA